MRTKEIILVFLFYFIRKIRSIFLYLLCCIVKLCYTFWNFLWQFSYFFFSSFVEILGSFFFFFLSFLIYRIVYTCVKLQNSILHLHNSFKIIFYSNWRIYSFPLCKIFRIFWWQLIWNFSYQNKDIVSARKGRNKKEKTMYTCSGCKYESPRQYNVQRHNERIHLRQKLNICCGKCDYTLVKIFISFYDLLEESLIEELLHRDRSIEIDPFEILLNK